jgi:putative transposase
VESFNGRLRQECLNANWFLSLADARANIAAWRVDYNEKHPHSALQWATPTEFARPCCRPAATAMSEEPEVRTSERY